MIQTTVFSTKMADAAKLYWCGIWGGVGGFQDHCGGGEVGRFGGGKLPLRPANVTTWSLLEINIHVCAHIWLLYQLGGRPLIHISGYVSTTPARHKDTLDVRIWRRSKFAAGFLWHAAIRSLFWVNHTGGTVHNTKHRFLSNTMFGALSPSSPVH